MAKKFKYKIKINKNCKNCGLCASFCPQGVLKLIDNKLTVVQPEKCRGCRICEKYCPDLAIEIKKKAGP